MGKELDKFVKDFKATKPKLKELSLQNGEKMKKEIIAHLNKTWTAEDVLKEAVIKARTEGVEGKKTADFIKHPAVAKPLKTWRDMLKTHTTGIKKLDDYNAQAKKLEVDLSKRVALVEKELKKSGGMSDMKAAAVLQEAKRALPDLKKAVKVMGSMPGHAVLYGASEARTVDAIVKGAIDSVTPKEFPEPFKEAGRKKTEKLLKDTIRKITVLCDQGMKLMEQGDQKKAEAAHKKAVKQFGPLADLEKQAKAAAKMKEELKKAKDGKVIAALLKHVYQTHEGCQKRLDELDEKIDDGPEQG